MGKASSQSNKSNPGTEAQHGAEVYSFATRAWLSCSQALETTGCAGATAEAQANCSDERDTIEAPAQNPLADVSELQCAAQPHAPGEDTPLEAASAGVALTTEPLAAVLD